MSNHKVVQNGGDGYRDGGGGAILDWILSSVHTLTQISGLLDGFERRPIGPRANRETMLPTPETVIQHESSCTCCGDTDAKPPWCLRALDCGSGKVGDAIAR